MPMPRRRSSFLGQECPAGLGSMSPAGTSALPGVFVGMAPTGGASSQGGRVSRRALGISSVFLQGFRSTSVPVVTQYGDRCQQFDLDGLNKCLVEYRDKVHALEGLNHQLEEQIRHCLDCKASSAGTWTSLKQDWEDVYKQMGDTILDNSRLMLQTENVQANADDCKKRYENEQPFRKAVEEELNSLYKVIDDANLTREDLESQIETMKNELRDLERSHTEDVRVLYKQLAGGEDDEPDLPIENSLNQILAFIRSHWEKVIAKNRAETDPYLECKQADSVNSKQNREEEELEGLKTECNDAGCKIQSLQAEIESIRALKRGLENANNDAKHWHDIELQNLGSVIAKLKAELADVRLDIEQQQQDYETLLNNKMKLELEIGTYHGILDGEENRFGSSANPGGSSVPEGRTAPTTSSCGPQGDTQTTGCDAPKNPENRTSD